MAVSEGFAVAPIVLYENMMLVRQEFKVKEGGRDPIVLCKGEGVGSEGTV